METIVCDNVYNCNKNCVINYLDAIRNHYCALRNKFIVAENELNIIKTENINLKETIKCYESKENIPLNLSPVLVISNNNNKNDLKTPTSNKRGSNKCKTPLTPKNNNTNIIVNSSIDKKKKLHVLTLFHDDCENNENFFNDREMLKQEVKQIKNNNFKSPASNKRLKQSKIDDKYFIKKINTTDTDETFCEELIIASPTSLLKKTQPKSCLRLRPKKSKASINIENANVKKFKEEPQSEIFDTNKISDDFEMKTLEPNIIFIEDTENYNVDTNTNDLFKNSETNTNLLNLMEANCLKNLEPDDSNDNEYTFNNAYKSLYEAFILCKDCERKKSYYKYIDELTDDKIKQLENECFKHRPKHNTPENFWKPYFTPTQD